MDVWVEDCFGPEMSESKSIRYLVSGVTKSTYLAVSLSQLIRSLSGVIFSTLKKHIIIKNIKEEAPLPC